MACLMVGLRAHYQVAQCFMIGKVKAIDARLSIIKIEFVCIDFSSLGDDAGNDPQATFYLD